VIPPAYQAHSPVGKIHLIFDSHLSSRVNLTTAEVLASIPIRSASG